MHVGCIDACIFEWMNAIFMAEKVDKTTVTLVLANMNKYCGKEDDKIIAFKVEGNLIL